MGLIFFYFIFSLRVSSFRNSYLRWGDPWSASSPRPINLPKLCSGASEPLSLHNTPRKYYLSGPLTQTVGAASGQGRRVLAQGVLYSAQGTKELIPQPLYYHSRHTYSTERSALDILTLMELLRHLASRVYPSLPNVYISLISKTWKKFLGTDICSPTRYIQSKDIRKHFSKNFFFPLTPLFHKRHFNTKS